MAIYTHLNPYPASIIEGMSNKSIDDKQSFFAKEGPLDTV